MYSDLGISVETWKSECNIEIGGHAKKSDKTNKKNKRYQLQRKIGEIRINYWTPTYGRAKAGQPARTYIQQLCEDTGCSPEDLPEVKNDREKW